MADKESVYKVKTDPKAAAKHSKAKLVEMYVENTDAMFELMGKISQLEKELKASKETARDRRKSLDQVRHTLGLTRNALRSCGDKAEAMVDGCRRTEEGYTEEDFGRPDKIVAGKPVDYMGCFEHLVGFVTAAKKIAIDNVGE